MRPQFATRARTLLIARHAPLEMSQVLPSPYTSNHCPATAEERLPFRRQIQESVGVPPAQSH